MNALVINSSGRTEQSVSRKLVAELVAELATKHPDLHTTYRDVATSLPFVNDLMIGGFYIPAEQRTPEQQQALAFSDQLVQELKAADVLIIGAPIYNFSIPASLKTWVDLIARAGLTFKFSAAGPEGLLTGKRAYLVITSGGVEVGSPYDLATPYLRQVLGFVGITDVQVISADRLNLLGEQPVSAARDAIRQIHAAA
ncbi:NAD(P)H-dependent oxidoreductase [Hymenobacter sp. BT664]|uniref:FMN dependent NADH:quinone oxidoreductase n=1 Tax=Hymenobacter montanus TaxID=2771359 RepID=A0A927BDY0_9BACT|nr:NAD(P)H-dependent oxidoreductase [Hymenobacter montanus]MBD2769055.1 NAD(P)H-dependent oxidoreductase [Hymenobacter montanus]